MQRTLSSSGWTRTLRQAASAVLPFVFILSAMAQTGPAPAAAPGQAAVTASLEASLDLVARDKKGAPVTDLKPGEVEITAGNSRVQMNELRLVKEGPGPDGAYLVTLVFDQLEPGNAKMARQAAGELLKAAPGSGVLFAVLKVDGRLRLLQEFTTDREALDKAVVAATIADPPEYSQANDAAEKLLTARPSAGQQSSALSPMLLAILLDSQKTALEPHTTPSAAALLAVSRGERAAPGRKTVVYFSQGLALDPAAPEAPGEILQAANRSRVSVYSIDAHIVDPNASSSLMAATSLAGASAGSGGIATAAGRGGSTPFGPGAEIAGGQQIGRIQTSAAGKDGPPLEVICQDTGGVRMGNSGDVRKNMRRIVADVTSHYEASFTPPAQTLDGKVRPVSVKALRAGVTLQARSGYFAAARRAAPAASGLSAASPREGLLLEALAAPKLPEALPFRSALLRLRRTPAGVENEVVVEAALEGNAGAAPVSVLAQVKDKTGAVIQKFSEDVPRQAAPEALSFRRHFRAAPGSYVLETAVLDPSGGKMGARRTDFEIAPAADGPALSDVVVVGRMEPLGGGKDRSNPLLCAEGEVVPNISGRVAREANPNVALFFEVRPDGRSSEKPVLQAEVRLNGDLIATVPLNLSANPGRNPVPYLAKLATGSLREGAYELTVIMSQGSKTAQAKVSFTLEGE